MDTFDCIATKLDIREYSKQKVPIEIREKVLEAARLTGTGLNTQHWRFIVVEDKGNLNKLAEDSTSGKWVSNANFAVGSGLFTGIREQNFREDFNIPESMNITIVVGFGYPAKKNLTGKRKNRLPINELVHYEIYR